MLSQKVILLMVSLVALVGCGKNTTNFDSNNKPTDDSGSITTTSTDPVEHKELAIRFAHIRATSRTPVISSNQISIEPFILGRGVISPVDTRPIDRAGRIKVSFELLSPSYSNVALRCIIMAEEARIEHVGFNIKGKGEVVSTPAPSANDAVHRLHVRLSEVKSCEKAENQSDEVTLVFNKVESVSSSAGPYPTFMAGPESAYVRGYGRAHVGDQTVRSQNAEALLPDNILWAEFDIDSIQNSDCFRLAQGAQRRGVGLAIKGLAHIEDPSEFPPTWSANPCTSVKSQACQWRQKYFRFDKIGKCALQ